jgi:hypothetical protein
MVGSSALRPPASHPVAPGLDLLGDQVQQQVRVGPLGHERVCCGPMCRDKPEMAPGFDPLDYSRPDACDPVACPLSDMRGRPVGAGALRRLLLT